MPYYWSMKSKTSITLSKEVVEAVDRLTPKGGSRSETIERLLRDSFLIRSRRARDMKDLEILNRRAVLSDEELNLSLAPGPEETSPAHGIARPRPPEDGREVRAAS